MSQSEVTEFWISGPVDHVPELLQPVAHTLLQVQREINQIMFGFPDSLMWKKIAGTASPAFHLQHIRGVLDRLFTYANERSLNADHLKYLGAEGKDDPNITFTDLLKKLNECIDHSILQLSFIDIEHLNAFRGVGRRKLPSTVLGLLFHAAEHSMRHTGQLLVTIKILKSIKSDS